VGPRLGLLEDGDVRIGVFRKCEEILIGGPGFDGVALQRVGAGEAEMGEWIGRTAGKETAVVQDGLKFNGRLLSLLDLQIGKPA
jgi:hypothetical protein